MDLPLRLLEAAEKALQQPTDCLIQIPERSIWAMAAVQANQASYQLIVPDLKGQTRFHRRGAKLQKNWWKRPLPHWARYAAGALLALEAEGLSVPSLKAVIVADESAGPRYDYAIGMAFAALIYAQHERPYPVETLLDLMERVRKNYLS